LHPWAGPAGPAQGCRVPDRSSARDALSPLLQPVIAHGAALEALLPA
jgi:hypothetical protein